MERDTGRLEERWAALQGQAANMGESEKEEAEKLWFKEAASFLLESPPSSHCWCQHPGLVGPLLKSFRHFYEEPPDKPLHALWQRMGQEFLQCIVCIVSYHRAKATMTEQVPSEEDAAKLAQIVQCMDDARVANTLAEFARRIRVGAYDDADEVFMQRLSFTLAEVLMFPEVLEDEEVDELIDEVVVFIESQRTLAYNGDTWPGIIALLFHNNLEMRRVALRIANSMPTFSTPADVEGLEGLVEKRIRLLEGDVGNPIVLREGTAQGVPQRPRRKQQEVALWLGLQTLLGLTEPAAMEALFLEPFPWLVSTVVHRASDISRPGFKFILNCLKLLFRGLRDRFWVGTTFMPANVRSMLVSNCYETREADMHKTIFELFQYFLQSLESRLDSKEYGEQRDLLLVQLLLRVPGSDNFSALSKKQAREVAFRVILRGYSLQPPNIAMQYLRTW